MEDWEEAKFEEIDDQIANNFQKVALDNEDDNGTEDEEGHTFNKFYGPVRAAFSNDSKLLEDFSSCQQHEERLKILLNIEVWRAATSQSHIIIIIYFISGPEEEFTRN